MVTAPAPIRGYEVVIGFETHTQLSTASKIFSTAPTAFGAAPNTQASVVDLALPGALPVMNRGAVERAIRFGLAVGGQIASHSIFARKNYFYPDLPKGYQISQYELPVVQGGAVKFMLDGAERSVRLTRAHLEEDAGKSVHGAVEGSSGIDLNRAGTPLLEIVSEPEMRSSKEAVEYAKSLHQLVVWLGICDGNMQEGSFRCDANVSVRRPGAPFGTRREIKNLNSFRFLQQAIDFEVQWQIDQLDDGLAIQQATVLFDPDTGETRAMRTKEDAHDYRYFPDPDLPPLVIDPTWIARVKSEMPELPAVMAERFVREDGLSPADAVAMTQSLAFARYYEAVKAAGAPAKLAANWLMGEVSRRLNAEERDIGRCPINAEALAALIVRVADSTIHNSSARQALDEMWQRSVSADSSTRRVHNATGNLVAGSAQITGSAQTEVDALIESMGLKQVSDTTELDRLLDEVIAANPKSVDEYRAGKDKAFNALVGQAMKASKGKANPAQLNELLKRKLAAAG